MTETSQVAILVDVSQLSTYDIEGGVYKVRLSDNSEWKIEEADVKDGTVEFSSGDNVPPIDDAHKEYLNRKGLNTNTQETIDEIISGDHKVSDDESSETKEVQIASLSETVSELLKNRISEAAKQWARAEYALKHGRRVLLWGPPGTGKSYIGKTHRDKSEITSLYLTMDTAGTEVRGCMMPNEAGGFAWVDGPLTVAWRKGHLAIVDEVDAASGDTLTELLKYLDDPESAWTTLFNNEQLTPDQNFQCLCTTNQQPTTLPEALLDRFDSVVRIDHPNPKAFSRDLWHSNIVREGALRVTYLRDAPVKTDAGRPVGLRAFRSIDRYAKSGLSLDRAACTALGESTGEWFARAVKIGEGEIEANLSP